MTIKTDPMRKMMAQKHDQQIKSDGISASLDEIRSSVESLGKTVSEDVSQDWRILALEKLFMQVYDALEKNRQAEDAQKAADGQVKLVQSNEVIATMLGRIIADESKQEMLVQAIHDGQRANVEMMGMIENSIVDALNAVGSKEVVFDKSEKVTQWNFHIVRNSSGDMTDIVANAKISM